MKWVIAYGGGRVTEAHFTPYSPTDASRRWMSPAMSDGFQSGLVRAGGSVARECLALRARVLARTQK
jgi:hypothetical protein